MKKKYYDEPAKQTVQAVDHCREEYAETLGVTRNAVDQLFAGRTHDAYPPFREQFKDVCLTKGSIPEAYLDDLQGIFQATRGASGMTVGEAFLDQLTVVHQTIETYARAAEDGRLDYGECVELIPLLSKLEERARRLKLAVMDRKNELAEMPNREFARYARRQRA